MSVHCTVHRQTMCKTPLPDNSPIAKARHLKPFSQCFYANSTCGCTESVKAHLEVLASHLQMVLKQTRGVIMKVTRMLNMPVRDIR